MKTNKADAWDIPLMIGLVVWGVTVVVAHLYTFWAWDNHRAYELYDDFGLYSGTASDMRRNQPGLELIRNAAWAAAAGAFPLLVWLARRLDVSERRNQTPAPPPPQ